MISKYLKYLFLLFQIFIFGKQISYAKIDLVLPLNNVCFSIDINQNFKSLEKEVQPNLGFLKEKSRFVVSKSVSAQNQHEFFEYFVGNLANGVRKLIDDLDVSEALSHLKSRKIGKRKKGIVGCHDKTAFFDQNVIRSVDAFKTANPDVLNLMNKMDEFEFAEMTRGLRDLMNNNKLKTFEEAIKSITKFDGEYGWLKYWNKTPGLKYSMTTILDLKKAGKLYPVGNAKDIQLATIQAFTRSGDFINQAKRYSPEFMGEFAKIGWKHAKEGFDELRKVPKRLTKGNVFSGKAFSKADFEKQFVGGKGKEVAFDGFVSSSVKEPVAEGFIVLSKQWVSSTKKVAVIRRIVTEMINSLKSKGYNIIKIKNTFKQDAVYKGININMRTKGGKVFELQFHTPNSFNVKQNINHSLYEKYRLLDPTSKEAESILKIMRENSKSITNPINVQNIK